MQLALEIETQAQSAQREINVVKTAVAAKQRDIRMLELTSSEVLSLEENTKVYRGVGKMCASDHPTCRMIVYLNLIGLYSVLRQIWRDSYCPKRRS